MIHPTKRKTEPQWQLQDQFVSLNEIILGRLIFFNLYIDAYEETHPHKFSTNYIHLHLNYTSKTMTK